MPRIHDHSDLYFLTLPAASPEKLKLWMSKTENRIYFFGNRSSNLPFYHFRQGNDIRINKCLFLFSFLFCGWSNNLEWTSNRSKAPPKRCLFSILPPSQDCSFPLGLGAPLSTDLEGALYKF